MVCSQLKGRVRHLLVVSKLWTGINTNSTETEKQTLEIFLKDILQATVDEKKSQKPNVVWLKGETTQLPDVWCLLWSISL